MGADSLLDAITLHIEVDGYRHREYSLFSGFLLCDVEPVSSSVLDDVGEPQLSSNVRDAQPKVGLQDQAGGDVGGRAVVQKASLDDLDNL